VPIPGRPPSLLAPPKGCRFFARCPYEPADARQTHPELETAAESGDHLVRCMLAPATRKEIWQQLKQGASPEQVKRSMSVETGVG
jgi:hypothetical protein